MPVTRLEYEEIERANERYMYRREREEIDLLLFVKIYQSKYNIAKHNLREK